MFNLVKKKLIVEFEWCVEEKGGEGDKNIKFLVFWEENFIYSLIEGM